MTYSLRLPAVSYLGEKSVSNIKEIIKREKVKKAIVLTDKTLRAVGICDILLEQLEGINHEIIDEICAEPSYQNVETVSGHLKESGGDIIIAVGGGSVMDTAKLCSVLKDADYNMKALLADPCLARKRIKTVMLPTTCGTGSEATCNAIVTVPEESVKRGIVNDEMIPDYVILDPQLIRKLPEAIVAATGVDAMAHVVECYTSLKATPFSNLYALEGARLIFGNLLRAYHDPDDLEAKGSMMLGAFYGGIAITASGTTAVHALSYPLGGKFHIAHGISNAVMFAPVMKYNREACEKELAEICDVVHPELYGAERAEKAQIVIDTIDAIIRKTNIPTNLKEYGVRKVDLDFLVEAGSKQKRLLDNNRKELTREEIRAIYEQVIV